MKWNELFDKCTKETGVLILKDKNTLKNVETDFGHLEFYSSEGIAYPHSIDELQKLLQFANKNNVPLTTRGYGLSQSGQSVATKDSIILDLSKVAPSVIVDETNQTVLCSSYVSWRDVCNKTLPYGLIPKVIPLNPDLSVAGTLSVGGIGATSHNDGLIIDHVKELSTITGDGQQLNCSANDNANLFYASLAGLGRCGVMTSAKVSLRKCKPLVRTFYFLYTDHETLLKDQKYIAESMKATYMESFCSSNFQGLRNTPKGRLPFFEWFYSLHVSFEFEQGEEIEIENIFPQLNFFKHTLTEDSTLLEYINRYAPRFELMRQTNAWELPHPWVECLLPFQNVISLIPNLLSKVTPALGDAHRIMFVANKKNNQSFFMHPDSSNHSVLFAILPMGIQKIFLESSLRVLTEIHDILIAAGGKRYLSGWLSMMNQHSWEKHFGEKFNEWCELKMRYDPRSILTSLLSSHIEAVKVT